MPMVFFLLANVADQGSQLRLADRERSVPALPEEARDPLLLHPLRGTLLDLLDDVGNSPGAPERQQRMDMIRGVARL